MSRLGIVLQARLGSSRLPGKVLRPLAGIPMIDRVVARLRQIRGADIVILATTDNVRDEPLAAHAGTSGLPVFRGSEGDVLDRYYKCACAFDLDPVMRATADNPFVDPEEGDRLIEFFKLNELDYAAASSDLGSELPVGVGLEIMSGSTLARSWHEGLAAHHREHVNEYLLENRALFRCGAPPTPLRKGGPGLRLTVDTEADFERAEDLIIRHAQEAGSHAAITTEWLVAAMTGRNRQ